MYSTSFIGLLGAQMNVLDDELCICDMSSSPLASYSAVSYQNSKAKEEDADELDDVLDEIGDNIYELTPSSPPLQTVDNVTKESSMEVKLPLSNLPETTTKKKQILVPLCKCTGQSILFRFINSQSLALFLTYIHSLLKSMRKEFSYIAEALWSLW